MSGVIHNNTAAAFQGFSISQPFLGAALQFYPEMGTQQLDDLINAYVPGSASILEKRATVSMDFFAYSQLTGETFKYYAIAGQSFSSTTSSAGSSPMQDSSYSSSFVSPVISDWSWSQSTPSSASASTPASVTHEAMSSKPSKKAASSAAKSQAGDFSHLPGMKIMTKDGRDVTNSASRGCKTKEQRDHAHLMRIIKACDACKKKKVRCDPSHKKRNATQSQGTSTSATPARLAKKFKKSAKDSQAVTEKSPQRNTVSTALSLVSEQPFAGLEIPDMSIDLPESWESFVQFDEESIDFASSNYDFFFDPAGHLSPNSNQSPTTPSKEFAQPQGSLNTQPNPDVSKPFPDELDARPPTLPYLEYSVPANNYVDFNLYSPEPSFLDDDVALLTDIGSAFGRDQDTLSPRSRLAQGRQSSSSPEAHIDPSPVAPYDQLVDYGATSSGSFLGGPNLEGSHRRSIPRSGVRLASTAFLGGSENLDPSTGEQSVSQVRFVWLTQQQLILTIEQSDSVSQTSVFNSFSSAQTVRLSHGTDGNLQPTQSHVPLPHVTSSPDGVRQGATATHAIISGATSRIPASSVSAPSGFSSSLEELSYYAQTTMTATGSGDCGVTESGATGTSSTVHLQASAPRLSGSRNTAAPLSFEYYVSPVFGLSGVQSLAAFVTGESFDWKRHARVNKSSNSQLLICTVLLVATFGMFASWLEAQAAVYGFLQIALGLAIYKAYQFTSSHPDSRPQQSRLSTTPEPQGFSDGARLLSCVSTRLRHTCRQNQGTHCWVIPARMPRILGLAQGFV
ncbi:uncharacterized protein ColSpa_09001 [Colletotrichum spaethianum]|uniref:Transcription factor Cys6 n=1 Tax=Colletotrichum spaethianum TaxID=700344 RepID=A0AA37PAX0_9PEZI|nr:uncharacterized protein ColSpa_09001 [Colletotrichum spaethianum]GKT48820.1 hypothetical protein ColSpa_09001 [Colletotrichum spaethianum]